MSAQNRSVAGRDVVHLLEMLHATVNTHTRMMSCSIGDVVWEAYVDTNRVLTLCDGRDPIVRPLDEVVACLGFDLPSMDILYKEAESLCGMFGYRKAPGVYRFGGVD